MNTDPNKMIWLVTKMRMSNLKLLIDNNFKYTSFQRGDNTIYGFVNDSITDESFRSMLVLAGIEMTELFEWSNNQYRSDLIKYHLASAEAIKKNEPCLPSEPSGKFSFDSGNRKDITEDFFQSPMNMWRTQWFVEDINGS